MTNRVERGTRSFSSSIEGSFGAGDGTVEAKTGVMTSSTATELSDEEIFAASTFLSKVLAGAFLGSRRSAC